MLTEKFVERNGETYRVLLQYEEGAWLISYQEPAPPFFVSSSDMKQLKRCPAPEEYPQTSAPERQLSQAEKKRLELIAPMLADERSITSKEFRWELAKRTAAETGTTAKRICRLYYRFLAAGRVTSERKKEETSSNEVYNWAIRELYFSSKRLSLRQTYEMMLIQRYSDDRGSLLPDAPSFSAFQHYFYRKGFHRTPDKVISREGLTHYQRNKRPAFGSASHWRKRPGAFQMDATQADIFIVSRKDRSAVLGRPSIYMAVDTATQLIAGIYVGMESTEHAVMKCIKQAEEDKVEYCRSHGISIKAAQWPNRGLPEEIISDKGREFTGRGMDELARRYGIQLQSLPPYRPDEKGIVEKTFDMLQNRYKPYLRGYGVVGPDVAERWAVDYRSQAVLDIEEFTQIVIHCVLYLNAGRVLSCGKTATELWLEYAPDLMEAKPGELKILTLPQMTVKLARKGFRVNSFWYAPDSMSGLRIGGSYTVAYDLSDISQVYVVWEDGFTTCPLAQGNCEFMGLTAAEGTAMRKRVQAGRRTAKERELAASIESTAKVQMILESSLKRGPYPKKNLEGGKTE